MDNLRIMDFIEAAAEHTPNTAALTDSSGVSLTYQQIVDMVFTMSEFLAERGIAPGKRVGFISSSALETALAFLAVSNVSAFIPLSPDFSDEQYKYYFDLLKIDYLIVTAQHKSNLDEIASDKDIPLIYLKQLMAEEGLVYQFSSEIDASSPRSTTKAKGQDIALVNYTSGTTSIPKIVPISHINICCSALKRIEDYFLTSNDRELIITPIFRTIGLNSVLASLFSSGEAICTDRFDLHQFCCLLKEKAPSHFNASPIVLQTILDHIENNSIEICCPSLRFIRSGGARLNESLQRRAVNIFNVPVIANYGTTETGNLTNTMHEPSGHKVGSVGVAHRDHVAIMDDNGQMLETGVTGEIVVRSPQVINRYDNDEQTNNESFYGEWFRTGDAGYLDHDGYLFITGRFKEIINRGGEKVSPYEVEEAILSHPDVLQAVVFPVPGLNGNEDVGAVLVLKNGNELNLKDLRRFLHNKIVAFKMPVILYVLSEIPIGNAGKIQRKNLYNIITSSGIEPQSEAGNNQCLILPRNQTEKSLYRIFRKILPIKNISIDDTFFELGGDSLRASILYDEISKNFRVQIPLKQIFNRGTIEELAAYINDNQTRKKLHPFLVPFQEEGVKKPLFFVHPAEGKAVAVRHIASQFDQERPFYSFDFNPNSKQWKHPVTIEQIARNYLEDIFSVQSEGPYILAGQCVGGIIAYEMARQLKKAKQEVSLLALFDTVLPGTQEVFVGQRKIESRKAAIKKNGFSKYLIKKMVHYGQLYQQRAFEFIYKKKPVCIKLFLTNPKINKKILSVARALYEIDKYTGTAIYFKPDIFLGSTDRSISKWVELLDSLQVITIPGNHNSVFYEENALNTRQALEKVLADLP